MLRTKTIERRNAGLASHVQSVADRATTKSGRQLALLVPVLGECPGRGREPGLGLAYLFGVFIPHGDGVEDLLFGLLQIMPALIGLAGQACQHARFSMGTAFLSQGMFIRYRISRDGAGQRWSQRQHATA